MRQICPILRESAIVLLTSIILSRLHQNDVKTFCLTFSTVEYSCNKYFVHARLGILLYKSSKVHVKNKKIGNEKCLITQGKQRKYGCNYNCTRLFVYSQINQTIHGEGNTISYYLFFAPTMISQL